MGGFLVVDSTPGVGSCFTFRASLRRAPASRAAPVGTVVVVGEPAHTRGLLERVAAWGAAASSAVAAGPREGVDRCGGTAAGPAVRRLRQWPLDLAALGDCIAAAETEPPNVVLVTSREQSDRGRLPGDAPGRGGRRAPLHGLHAALAQPDAPVPMSSPDRQPPRPALEVLVAEDNRINQQVIERMLQQRRPCGHAGRRWRAGAGRARERTHSTSC